MPENINNTDSNIQTHDNKKLRFGLIINPYAGIGGALALKGSDGTYIREKALAAGAKQQAMKRTQTALSALQAYQSNVEFITAEGDMGANTCKALKLPFTTVYNTDGQQTEAQDTINAVRAILDNNIDLLIFAGGDGTARNVVSSLDSDIPVIGIPAGCKIHSGVYTVTPQAAGVLLSQIVKRELVSLMSAEVRDIDEEKFRAGTVIAKYYGELQVPAELSYIQAVKMGGKESDDLVLIDIAAEIQNIMDEYPEHYFVMGSGSTVDFVMQELGLPNTLLGVDVVYQQEVVASDVTSQELIETTQGKNCKLCITAIGGQGHIFGRGNQQLSADFLRTLQRDDILIVATKNKLKALGEGGFIADTGEQALDESLAGPISVISGYKDRVLYFVRG